MVNQVAPVERDAVPLARGGRAWSTRRPSSPAPRSRIEAKVVILCAGAMGTPPILMRSQLLGALAQLSPHLGRHLGMNGDHVAAIEVSERAVRQVLDLPGYTDFHKGKPITTMTLRLLGRQARQRARRHPLHPPGDPALAAHQLPLRRRPLAGRRADLVGQAEEALDLDLEPPHRDPGDGRGHGRRPVLRGPAERQRPRPAERGPDRDRPLQLRPLGAVDAGPRAG